METATIYVIQQSELTDKQFNPLFELASYKHESRGFSFFVLKDYIEGYIRDVKNDWEEDPDYQIKMQEEVDFLSGIVSKMSGRILLIDNDNLTTGKK